MAETNHNARLIRHLCVNQPQVDSLAWSPDGKGLGIVGDVGVMVVTTEGRMLWHASSNGTTWSIAWSPDGLHIATGQAGGLLQLWDARTGIELRRWQGHTSGVSSLAFAPDGRLVSGAHDITARVWAPTTGSELLCCHMSEAVSAVGAAISPDGNMLALAGSIGIQVWDAHTGREIARCHGHTNSVLWLAFSHDGSLLASSSFDGTVRVWDPHVGAELACCKGHERSTHGVAFSPDGAVLASSGHDGTVRLWQARTGRFLAHVGKHSGIVGCIAFSPDGDSLASASREGTAALWDVSEWVKPVPTRPPANVASWVERQAETVGRRPAGGERPMWVPSLDTDGVDRCIGMLRRTRTSNSLSAPRIAMDGGSRTLLSGHQDGRVVGWKLETGTTEWESRERHEEPISCIALSPDGSIVATGASDGVILWDPRSGALLARIGIAHRYCSSLSWSPNSQRLACGYNIGPTRVWEARSGNELLHLGNDHVYGVSFSPDGRTLACCGGYGLLGVWTASAGEELFRCPGPETYLRTVKFSPDGGTLVCGGFDTIVRIWDALSGAALQQCMGHGGEINSLALTPDGRVLASGSSDRTIRLWDPVAVHEIHRFACPEEAKELAFSPDGAFLASGHPGDVIRLWDMRQFVRQAPRKVSDHASQASTHQGTALPRAWAALERAGLHLPLSLLRDLLELCAGRDPETLSSLAEHPSIRRLAALGWPTAARVGLVALLAHEIRDERWAPPDSHGIAELRKDLENALKGASVEPRPAPVPVALLSQAADQVDDRTMTLLHALGPDTVAADPGLVLQLRAQAHALPELTISQRRLLDRPLLGLDAGQAQGAGTGAERGGIAPRGPLTALLSSQLVYPSDLLALKHHDGGLLYRARTGRQRPELRPTVLLLDVSPGCFGPIESITRPAAFVIARALRRRALPVRLVALGGQAKVRPLERPQDLLEVLTIRSFRPVEIATALRTAERAAAELGAEVGGPVLILLLTQPYWGAEVPTSLRLPGLRALFVQYPGQQVRPSFAGQCERWESIGVDDSERLAQVVGRLVA